LLLHSLRFAFSLKQPDDAASSSSSASGGNLSSWKDQSDDELWKCAFPMIRYFGLVNFLQRQLKGDNDADWNAQTKSR